MFPLTAFSAIHLRIPSCHLPLTVFSSLLLIASSGSLPCFFFLLLVFWFVLESDQNSHWHVPVPSKSSQQLQITGWSLFITSSTKNSGQLVLLTALDDFPVVLLCCCSLGQTCLHLWLLFHSIRPLDEAAVPQSGRSAGNTDPSTIQVQRRSPCVTWLQCQIKTLWGP